MPQEGAQDDASAAARGAPGDPRLTPDPAPFYEPWRDPHRDYAPSEPPTTFSGPALEVERRVLGFSRVLDRVQSRVALVGFAYAAFKKYSDDEGSRLAALLAYYTFLSLFPLVIGGLAVLNSVLVNRPDAALRVVHDIVPLEYQAQVISAYQALPDGGGALAVAVIGLLLAGTGGVFSLYAMVNQVFAVPYRFRYGFGPRYAMVFLLVLVLGVGVLVVVIGSALLSTVADVAFIQRVGGWLLIWSVAAAILLIVPRVLARRQLAFAEIWIGAVLGGLAMMLFMSLGSLAVSHFISTSSAVYGVFATVVGIFTVMFIVSNAVVLSYEIGVVWAWQLWPRGVDINLLFPADERAYALLSLMDERMPSQRNGVAFDAIGHDDPRRADLALLRKRSPGVPLRPYDLKHGRPVPADETPADQVPADETSACETRPEPITGDDSAQRVEEPTTGSGVDGPTAGEPSGA